MHGAGERGANILDIKRTGLPKLLDTEEDFPFLVISPQCQPGSYWNPSALNSFAEEVFPKFAIDKSRLYLTGLSMGGYGTWLWAIQNPERFAAIAPICGGGDPPNVSRLKEMPIWAFHGAKDDIVPLSESVEMIKALKRAGIESKFTIYPNASHDSWTEKVQQS